MTLSASHTSSPLGFISSFGSIHLLSLGIPFLNSMVYVNRDSSTPAYQSYDVPEAGTNFEKFKIETNERKSINQINHYILKNSGK